VTVLARIERGRLIPGRRHAPREEYFRWVRGVLPNPAGVKMRRYFYNRFVSRWPNLDAWFAEPLLVQLDLHGRSVREIGRRTGPSHDAGSYLAYLSLVHGVAMDAAWVLSRNFDSLFVPRIAAGLGLDFPPRDGRTVLRRGAAHKATLCRHHGPGYHAAEPSSPGTTDHGRNIRRLTCGRLRRSLTAALHYPGCPLRGRGRRFWPSRWVPPG
jgi:hypothetical protein